MKSTLIKHGFLAGTLLGLPLVTHAYDLPTVNLGMTSFSMVDYLQGRLVCSNLFSKLR